MRETIARSAAQLQAENEQLRQKIAQLEAMLPALRSLSDSSEAEKLQRYQALLLMHVSDALISTDLQKQILSWNHGAEKMFGWSAEEALGRLVDELIDVQYVDATYQDVDHSFAQTGQWAGRTRQSRKDGTYCYFYTSVSLLFDQAGVSIGALAVDRDINEQVLAEQALAHSEARFRTLFERNRAVQIVIDPVSGDMLDGNQAALDFYGYTREAFRKLKVTDLNPLPPDHVHSKLGQAVSGEVGTFIFPHRLASGEVRTVEIHPSTVELDGRPVIYSIIHDITDRKHMETALIESERRYREIIERQAEGVFITDAAGMITFANPMAEMLAGVRPGGLTGMNVDQFVQREMLPQYFKQVEMLSQGVQASLEVVLKRPDGKTRDLYITSSPRFNEQNEYLGAINITRDISNFKLSEKKLRYDATHDALTDVYNRTFYEEMLESLNTNGHYPISVIMVDVDGLKTINDRLGHASGDLLLQRAAAIISESTRSDDMVMRIGGDEFLVFLPETTIAQVQRVRERIEQVIGAENDAYTNPFNISLSIGTYTSLRPGALREAVDLADMEMYHVKRQKKHSVGK